MSCRPTGVGEQMGARGVGPKGFASLDRSLDGRLRSESGGVCVYSAFMQRSAKGESAFPCPGPFGSGSREEAFSERLRDQAGFFHRLSTVGGSSAMASSSTLLSFLSAECSAVWNPSSAGTAASIAASTSTTPTTKTLRSTTVLPPGASILVTDSLAVSAQPWLVHFVARALRPPAESQPHHRLQRRPSSGSSRGGQVGTGGVKASATAQKKRRVIVLGVREREEWWTGVLKKSVRTNASSPFVLPCAKPRSFDQTWKC